MKWSENTRRESIGNDPIKPLKSCTGETNKIGGKPGGNHCATGVDQIEQTDCTTHAVQPL